MHWCHITRRRHRSGGGASAGGALAHPAGAAVQHGFYSRGRPRVVLDWEHAWPARDFSTNVGARLQLAWTLRGSILKSDDRMKERSGQHPCSNLFF
jgi:hypothetical protein